MRASGRACERAHRAHVVRRRWQMPRTVEKDLLDLERRYWQALQNQDVEMALKLSDDPCIVSGAQGVASLDRDTMAGMLSQGTWQLRKFEIDPDVKVKMLG